MGRLKDLEVAFEVADQAAALALRYFETGVMSTRKADGSPVTEADHAVERLLRESLKQLRPEDAVLGEEHGHVGDSEHIWILDPIDGTGFFSRRDPNWRIHVTLELHGVTELAVVTSPALGLRWWATRGGGAFESAWPRIEDEARRLAVSLTSSVDNATIDALDSPERGQLPVGFRPPSSPLPLVELVRGQIDGFLAERYFKWDHARRRMTLQARLEAAASVPRARTRKAVGHGHFAAVLAAAFAFLPSSTGVHARYPRVAA